MRRMLLLSTVLFSVTQLCMAMDGVGSNSAAHENAENSEFAARETFAHSGVSSAAHENHGLVASSVEEEAMKSYYDRMLSNSLSRIHPNERKNVLDSVTELSSGMDMHPMSRAEIINALSRIAPAKLTPAFIKFVKDIYKGNVSAGEIEIAIVFADTVPDDKRQEFIESVNQLCGENMSGSERLAIAVKLVDNRVGVEFVSEIVRFIKPVMNAGQREWMIEALLEVPGDCRKQEFINYVEKLMSPNMSRSEFKEMLSTLCKFYKLCEKKHLEMSISPKSAQSEVNNLEMSIVPKHSFK